MVSVDVKHHVYLLTSVVPKKLETFKFFTTAGLPQQRPKTDHFMDWLFILFLFLFLFLMRVKNRKHSAACTAVVNLC